MSARKRRLALTHNAQRDFRSLLANTERQWGISQRHTYRQRILEAFAELVEFPDMGPARPDLGQEVRTFRVGQHVVVYQPSDTEILILRISHVRRDLDAEFVQGES
jgi:toxin ParE1/3/4